MRLEGKEARKQILEREGAKGKPPEPVGIFSWLGVPGKFQGGSRGLP